MSQEERCTDLGNARRLVRYLGHVIRHDGARGWMFYDESEGRWRKDNTGYVARCAKAAVAEMYREAAELDEETRKRLAAWAVKSESEARIKAMIALAASEEDVAVQADIWDRDPFLLNVQNGTVDLASRGWLRRHAPEDHITQRAGTWAPDQYRTPPQCPTWLAFLDRIFGGRAALIEFVQRAFGYSLTGSTEEQVMFFLYGMGANGKSTLLRVLLELLRDYARQADPDLLLARRGEVHPTNVADLSGARVVVCSEVEAGRRMAESLVKQLTGGDRLKARFMRGDFFEFEPTFKVWLGANHKPEIRGTDNAIWRRIRLIPFDVTIPPEEQDRTLMDKLREELPGVMAWAIEGFHAWREHGLGVPDVVRAATEGYRDEMDVLAGFLTEECELGDGQAFRTSATDLYRRHRAWCEENGESSISQKAFGMRLGERGFQRFRDTSTGRSWWKGLRLKDAGLLKGSEGFSRKTA
jgi:putative DNA primase/helicase